MSYTVWLTFEAGLAVFTALLNSELRSRFANIPGYGTDFNVPRSAADYRKLHEIPDLNVRNQVITEFANSFGVSQGVTCNLRLSLKVVQVCFIVGATLIGVALFVSQLKTVTASRVRSADSILPGHVVHEELPHGSEQRRNCPSCTSTIQ